MSGTTEASASPSDATGGHLARQPRVVDRRADQQVQHQPSLPRQLVQLTGEGELLGGVGAIDQGDLARAAVVLGASAPRPTRAPA